MQHFYSIINAMLVLQAVYPKSESCQISSDCRYMECYTFQWSISPRFVIRSIDTQILSQQYIIIFFIHDAITTIQITRYKNHFYLIFRTIAHSQIFQHIQHLIMSHIMQPMSDKWYFERSVELLLAFQTSLQILTGVSYPTGYIDECQNILMQILIPVQAV